MRAILIDPFERTITEIDTIEPGNLDSYYAALSRPGAPVTTFDVARYDEADIDIYVDDEGLITGRATAFFQLGDLDPLAGRGVVVSTDDEGNSMPPRASLEQVRAMTRWITPISINGKICFLREAAA
ncbi:DUF3846 domain-containing protein [Caldimonas sp. KR1-144]|uniref:DUF3846 domain-containing protein n=1 Tax=Caldimonas sp. KR1-144 TaxID=3400911 RepID=UPI003BFB0075